MKYLLAAENGNGTGSINVSSDSFFGFNNLSNMNSGQRDTGIFREGPGAVSFYGVTGNHTKTTLANVYMGQTGIGTTAPSSTLHVSGTARVSSWTTIASNVTPSAALDVYGTISATNLLVNGVPVTGQTDRIVSGTANVIANNSSGVSMSVPLEVSGSMKLSGLGTEPCNSPEHWGRFRMNPTTGAMEICRQ
jgi:hypothetical protein